MSDIEANTELDGSTPYVFATGTSLGATRRAQAVVEEVFGTCALRTRQEDDFDFNQESGFTFTELSKEDPIEGSLRESLDEHDQVVSELARGPASPFVEPFSFIIVGISFVVGELVTGFTQRAGADLYDAVEARRRGSDEPEPATDVSSRLERLFEGLGHSYSKTSLTGGPILLRVTGPEVTFLCEPDLPDAAVRAAIRLVLRDDLGSAETSRPLRWSAEDERWAPLPDGWAKKKAMRKLNRELSSRVKDER